MDESLKNDLELLFSKHPELKNSNVVFKETDFLISDNINDYGSLKVCEVREPWPDIIRGHSHKVEIRKSSVHGYGVFAKERIDADELIEESKLLKLANRATHNHDAVLMDYVWGQ